MPQNRPPITKLASAVFRYGVPMALGTAGGAGLGYAVAPEGKELGYALGGAAAGAGAGALGGRLLAPSPTLPAESLIKQFDRETRTQVNRLEQQLKQRDSLLDEIQRGADALLRVPTVPAQLRELKKVPGR